MWLFICLSRSAASLTADSNRWISAGISSGFSTRLGQISVVRCSITTTCPMPTPPETPIPFIILLMPLLLSLGWSGALFLLVFFGFFILNNSAYLINSFHAIQSLGSDKNFASGCSCQEEQPQHTPGIDFDAVFHERHLAGIVPHGLNHHRCNPSVQAQSVSHCQGFFHYFLFSDHSTDVPPCNTTKRVTAASAVR